VNALDSGRVRGVEGWEYPEFFLIPAEFVASMVLRPLGPKPNARPPKICPKNCMQMTINKTLTIGVTGFEPATSWSRINEFTTNPFFEFDVSVFKITT